MQLKSHPSFIYATDIKKLCEPLHLIDITTFSHLRVFDNHQLTVQCNKPEFLLNYLNKQYYTADPCVHVKPESTDLGEYLIWDTIDCSGETAKMLADSVAFDFKHAFTIIKKQSHFTDFYHFGTHLSNPAIHQIYINNLDLLDRFITFFNTHVQHSNTLSRAYDIVLNLGRSTSNVVLHTSDDLLFNQHVKREMVLQRLLSSTEKLLTPNETICAALILQGKTAKEIAKDLGLSYRTIEDRIGYLKIKLNAKNKADLVVKLLGK